MMIAFVKSTKNAPTIGTTRKAFGAGIERIDDAMWRLFERFP